MQGLPKKIKIDLLLADLALQFGNPLARLLDLSHRLLRRRPLQLFLRSTFAPQRFRATQGHRLENASANNTGLCAEPAAPATAR
jgi:hypothetical protein